MYSFWSSCRSKKLVKQGGGGNKAHLKDLLPADNKVGVVSHVCKEEEESEDEGLDVVESHEVLEEEGVVLSAQAKRASMKVRNFKLQKTTPIIMK